MKNFEQFMNESSLSRFWSSLAEHDCGAITAFRSYHDCGRGDKITLKENLDRNKRLKALLNSKGYATTKVDGIWVENFGTENQIERNEDTFIVVDSNKTNKLESILVDLGEEYDQEAIIYIPKYKVPKGEVGSGLQKNITAYMVGTSHCPNLFLKFNQRKIYGHITFGRTAEIFTKVSNRPFYLSNDHEEVYKIDNLIIDPTPGGLNEASSRREFLNTNIGKPKGKTNE